MILGRIGKSGWVGKELEHGTTPAMSTSTRDPRILFFLWIEIERERRCFCEYLTPYENLYNTCCLKKKVTQKDHEAVNYLSSPQKSAPKWGVAAAILLCTYKDGWFHEGEGSVYPPIFSCGRFDQEIGWMTSSFIMTPAVARARRQS
jgi:hypothetical protein